MIRDVVSAVFIVLGIIGGFMYFLDCMLEATPKWIKLIKKWRRK